MYYHGHGARTWLNDVGGMAPFGGYALNSAHWTLLPVPEVEDAIPSVGYIVDGYGRKLYDM